MADKSMSAQSTPATPEESSAVVVTPHGYTDAFGRNVANILAQGTRVIVGRVPAQVRAELRAAVKAGVLGRLKTDGLKPEIFFHPDHRNDAIERQDREAAYSIKCIASVMVSPAEFRAGIEAMGGDVEQVLLGRAKATGGAA